jgi:hypothetical protein
MKPLVRTKLGRTFLITFILLSLPIMAAGWLGIRSATRALRNQSHIMLRVASDGAQAEVNEFLQSLKRTTESRAGDPEIRLALNSPAQRGRDLIDLLKRLRTRVQCLPARA